MDAHATIAGGARAAPRLERAGGRGRGVAAHGARRRPQRRHAPSRRRRLVHAEPGLREAAAVGLLRRPERRRRARSAERARLARAGRPRAHLRPGAPRARRRLLQALRPTDRRPARNPGRARRPRGDLRLSAGPRRSASERAADHQRARKRRHRPRLRRRAVSRTAGAFVDGSCERLVVLHLGSRRDDGVWTDVRVRLRSPTRAEPRRQLSPEPVDRARHDRARAIGLSVLDAPRRARGCGRRHRRHRRRRQRDGAHSPAGRRGPARVDGGLRRREQPEFRPPADLRARGPAGDVPAAVAEQPLATVCRSDQPAEPATTPAA